MVTKWVWVIGFVMWVCAVAVAVSEENENGVGRCRAGNGAVEVRQKQVGFGAVPKFMVAVHNACGNCPAMEVVLRCGNFSQTLVDPSVLRVLGHDACAVHGGLPISPLQTVSFVYAHQKFPFSLRSSRLLCEQKQKQKQLLA